MTSLHPESVCLTFKPTPTSIFRLYETGIIRRKRERERKRGQRQIFAADAVLGKSILFQIFFNTIPLLLLPSRMFCRMFLLQQLKTKWNQCHSLQLEKEKWNEIHDWRRRRRDEILMRTVFKSLVHASLVSLPSLVSLSSLVFPSIFSQAKTWKQIPMVMMVVWDILTEKLKQAARFFFLFESTVFTVI